jgi:hypothetical protein
VHIEALVSADTFGVSTLVPSATAASGARPWRMYEHSVAIGPNGRSVGTADGSWLMVPPVLAASMGSGPVEARWVDGSRVQWWSRRTSVGHGEASSGLAYDGLHPTSDTLKSLGQ